MGQSPWISTPESPQPPPRRPPPLLRVGQVHTNGPKRKKCSNEPSELLPLLLRIPDFRFRYKGNVNLYSKPSEETPPQNPNKSPTLCHRHPPLQQQQPWPWRPRSGCPSSRRAPSPSPPPRGKPRVISSPAASRCAFLLTPRDPPPSAPQPPCGRARLGASSRSAPPPSAAVPLRPQDPPEEAPRTGASSWHGNSIPRSVLLLCRGLWVLLPHTQFRIQVYKISNCAYAL